MKKILLINPEYSRTYFSLPVLPAGLGYLAESLGRHSIDYRVIDMSLGYKTRPLYSEIRKFRPDFIGITCISYMLKNTYEVVRGIKEMFPDVKIVIGGPHVSSIKEEVLKQCEALDFAIVGEGEVSLPELILGKPQEGIKGLIFREGENLVFNGHRDFFANLDSLGFPKYKGFEMNRYGYKMIGIVTSRGCPYSCIYCSCNVIGKQIRFRSANSIVEEIQYWYGLGYREFGIQEDNPTFDRSRMLQICSAIQKKGFKGLKLMCGNGVRADRVDRQLLIEMKKAGFKRLAFGVESGSDKVLKAIRKGSTVEIMDRAIREATDLGFFVSLFFLVGSPSETNEDVLASVSLALKYPVQCIDFFNLIPLPGSELFDWVRDNGYFLVAPENYLNARQHPARSVFPVFQTPEFPGEERMRMLRHTKNITRKVKRRALREKFPQLGKFGDILFYIYCSDFVNSIEHFLLSSEVIRKSLGRFRMKLRDLFYE
ncbi:MAG: radical SAM protein [Candidatus Omnitrophica bacterium]|nr:radical SAM protein [Candidatus Omnitrophota bacterium]